MTSCLAPRVVVVTRATEYEQLLARHATRQQAAFFLERRGQSLSHAEHAHQLATAAAQTVAGAIPASWRRAQVSRRDLHLFVFESNDIVVAVGQDGLVANVAKYLKGQPVVGVNPDPSSYDGVLVPHSPDQVAGRLRAVQADRCQAESRRMVVAVLEDGQQLVALNELFVGHRTHQSARYLLDWAGTAELQSSSGVIVTTGTGATGWARSISRQRAQGPTLPAPTEPRLVFFSREPFPSVGTGVKLQDGSVPAGQQLRITSHMNEGGVIFGDGIEEDRIDFHWGMTATIEVASTCLQLVR